MMTVGEKNILASFENEIIIFKDEKSRYKAKEFKFANSLNNELQFINSLLTRCIIISRITD